jgi:phospholipid N-methyltransferase
MANQTLRFLSEFVNKPFSTGAILPSSSSLAEAMVAGLGLSTAEAVLEYGPGTGVFTDYIVRDIKTAAQFLAIEINPRFAAAFRLRHPRLRLVEESAVNVHAICERAGIQGVDCIVCGLPWASFPQSLQTRLLDEMMRVLKPGGRFVTFAYIHGLGLPPGRRFARLLPKYFTKVVRSPVVWSNVPPAFVYRCVR